MSRQQILTQITNDLKNPEHWTISDNVQYATKILPNLITELKNLSPDEKKALAITISNYANYLANQISLKKINTKQCAYLISTINRFCEMRNFEFSSWLENLQREIALHFITQDFTKGCETRYLIQYFYQLTKLLKRNNLVAGLFFEMKDAFAIINKKIHFLLASIDSNAQDIANTFLALGYLAQQGKTYALSDQIITALLQKLVSVADAKPQEIANVFLAFGYLAQQGKTYALSDQIIMALLQKLVSAVDAMPQHIANIFLALGYLAQQGKTYALSDQIITALLQKLVSAVDAKPQEIANVFLAFGYLAQQGKTYALSDQIIMALLQKLVSAVDAMPQHIANIFLALGYLAQQGKTYALSDQIITALLQKLVSAVDAKPQEIANTFFALGYLAQKNCLANVTHSLISELFTMFINATASSIVEKAQMIQACYRLHVFSNYSLPVMTTLENTIKRCTIKSSGLHLNFSNFLQKKISVSVINENYICGYPADIYLTLPNGKSIIVELDGEQHYQKNGLLCVEDTLRDTLLERAGYTVIRIKNNDAMAMLVGEKEVPAALSISSVQLASQDESRQIPSVNKNSLFQTRYYRHDPYFSNETKVFMAEGYKP